MLGGGAKVTHTTYAHHTHVVVVVVVRLPRSTRMVVRMVVVVVMDVGTTPRTKLQTTARWKLAFIGVLNIGAGPGIAPCL